MKKETGMPPISEASDQKNGKLAPLEEEIKASLENAKFGPFKFPSSVSKHELIKVDGELCYIKSILEGEYFEAVSLKDNSIIKLTPQEYNFKEIGYTFDTLSGFGLGAAEEDREKMKNIYKDEKEAGYSKIFGEYQKK